MSQRKKHTPTSKRRSHREQSIEPWEDIVRIQDDDYDDECHRQATDPLGLMSGDAEPVFDAPSCPICDGNGCDMCPNKYDGS